MLIDSLNNCIIGARKKGWDKIFIAVDIHDTIVKGNYDINELPTSFLYKAKETLQYLSTRKDIVLILYTCSHLVEIEKYFKFFADNDIIFKHCNSNPDVPNNALGRYDDKHYFNILLDDKAGFNGHTEWSIIWDFFHNNTLLNK